MTRVCCSILFGGRQWLPSSPLWKLYHLVVSLRDQWKQEDGVLTVQDNLQLLQEPLLIHGGQLVCVIFFSLFYISIPSWWCFRKKKRKVARCGATSEKLAGKCFQINTNNFCSLLKAPESNKGIQNNKTQKREEKEKCVF